MAKKNANGKGTSKGSGKATTPGNGSVPIDSIRHTKEKRVNIPTEELRDFVAADEATPGTVLYPRDPSLDPQLVWKGKDQQDAQPLAVPSVPIYVQEKIHPQAIIEAVRAQARKAEPNGFLPGLFADFNGLDDFDKKIDFYHHAHHWTNRFVLGDSLHVMTSLADKEGLKGKVQMIYVDPPYGIKFGSNWQVSMRKRDVKDGKPEDATRQPEQICAFRNTWKLGIHSYLAYLRDRLSVAREMLSETGSVFVQIGDQNVHLVRSVLDEVFGSEQFINQITFKKTTGATSDFLPGTTDYLLWYAKDIEQTKYRPLFRQKIAGGIGTSGYSWVQDADGLRRRMTLEEQDNRALLPSNMTVFTLDNLTSQSAGRRKGEGAASWFTVGYLGMEFRPTMQSRWKTNEEGMKRLILANRLGVAGNILRFVRFINDFPAFPLTDFWWCLKVVEHSAL